MKRSRYVVVPALLIMSLVVATASVKMPRGQMTGETGPSGCPVVSVDGTIDEIDLDRQAILLTPKGQGDAVPILIDEGTKFRIPGVKKENLRSGGLAKVPANASVKLKFCADTGEVTEVKVKKEKKKSTT